MKKTTVILYSSILFLLLSAFSTGQQTVTVLENYQEDGIHWITWEEAMTQMQVEKRKIVVDLYTDWCGWCKRMDRTTFQNKEIVEYLNKNYYAVKFNAEQKETISIGDKTYKFVKTTNTKGSRGYHELAQVLSKGRLTFPTFVFLNEEGNILQPIPGYKDAPTFEMIMTYFGGNHYKSVPWDMYQEKYVPLKGEELAAPKD